MSIKAFKELPAQDQDIIIAKLIHAVKKSNVCLESAIEIIDFAEVTGVFEGAKFGSEEVYHQQGIGVDETNDDLAGINI